MIAPLRQIPGTALIPDEERARASVDAVRASGGESSIDVMPLVSVLLSEGESGVDSVEDSANGAMQKTGEETVRGRKTFSGGLASDSIRGDVKVPMGACARSSRYDFARLIRRSEVVGVIDLMQRLAPYGYSYDYEKIHSAYNLGELVRSARQLIEDFEAETNGMTPASVWAVLLSALTGEQISADSGLPIDPSAIEEIKRVLAQYCIAHVRSEQEDGSRFMPPNKQGHYGDTLVGRIFGLSARIAALEIELGKCTTPVVVPDVEHPTNGGGG